MCVYIELYAMIRAPYAQFKRGARLLFDHYMKLTISLFVCSLLRFIWNMIETTFQMCNICARDYMHMLEKTVYHVHRVCVCFLCVVCSSA